MKNETMYKEKNNFDIGNEFKKIIYFLLLLIIILIGTIIFFVIKNNEMSKELSEYTCESDIMEQDGVYNFIDSKGNMITTGNHITACVNGYIIDTWDCNDKKIEYIWKINKKMI